MRGTRADLERAERAAAKRTGLPVRGRHVGGGRHVDPDDGRKLGWTLRVADVREREDEPGVFEVDLP
ncbi:MAG: hypothetical protein NUW01_01585 [Gemmatimonadaceae bacterium]|nr:hypothetical protein [Gemmatimonadaceae bacterium]